VREREREREKERERERKKWRQVHCPPIARVHTSPGKKFSKVSSLVHFCSKFSSELSFQNFYLGHHPGQMNVCVCVVERERESERERKRERESMAAMYMHIHVYAHTCIYTYMHM